MAYCLVFRKDNVEILSLGVGHPLAAAFLNKPYDEWKPMARTEFSDGMHTLIRQCESLEDDMELYTKMAELAKDGEERWQALMQLSDAKKEYKAITNAKVMLKMLEMIWEEPGPDDGENKTGLEWGVF